MGVYFLYVQKVGDYVKSTSGLSIRKKAELIRKINKSKSLNELFTIIRRENIDFQMFNQPVLTGITQIISELKPIESEKDIPFERVKKKAREAILASSDDFRKNGTVGKNEEKVIREINKCKSLNELFTIISRENIDLEKFSQYKPTSVTPGVLEIKHIKNKRELPFERIKEMAIASVLAIEDDTIQESEAVAENTADEIIEEVIEAAVDEVMEEIENGQMPEELIEVIYNENNEQVTTEELQDIPCEAPKAVEKIEVNTQLSPAQKTVSINNEYNNENVVEVNAENKAKIPLEIPLDNIREKVRQVFVEQIKSENTEAIVAQNNEVSDEAMEMIENCHSFSQIFQMLEQKKIEINMKSHTDASCISHRELSKKKADDKNDTPYNRLKKRLKIQR